MKTYGKLGLLVPEGSDPPRFVEFQEKFVDGLDSVFVGSKNQLLVCNSSGVPQPRTMKGDATLAEDGTLTIANDAINAAKIAENAVGASEIAANAVGASEIAEDAVGASEIATGAVGLGELAAAAKPFTWYTPKIIATEETRANAAYGVMTTPDKVEGVVLPTSGLILIGYAATWKSSVAAAGRAAIFLGATEAKMAFEGVKGAPVIQQAQSAGTGFGFLTATSIGLRGAAEEVGTSQATTGQIMGVEAAGGTLFGGFTAIFAAAGTYDISVQFKATSGSVTAKERKLWVATLGV